MQNEPLELFLAVCKKPRMCLQSGRYETICAFIDGYNMALQGAPLMVFREWLLAMGTEWTNLPWWALVRKSVYPDADLSQPPSESEDDVLNAALLRLLEDYSMARMKGGVTKIVYDYCQWLLRGGAGELSESLLEELTSKSE